VLKLQPCIIPTDFCYATVKQIHLRVFNKILINNEKYIAYTDNQTQ